MPADLTHFIVAQLRSHGLPAFGAKSKRPNINTFCPTGHDKETASLSIHRHDGRFLCFGCGIKGKNWNHLANYLSIDTLSDEAMPDPFVTFTMDLSKSIQDAMAEFELPWDLEPWYGNYVHDEEKGVVIAEETILALDGCSRFDDIYRCPRLFFPVRQYGELMGWVSRRLDKPIPGVKYERKYLNAPDMKSSRILFPLDEIEQWDTNVVVLVEGPLDAVRLINYDIPALAIMGTGNYHDDNRIDLLNLGIEKVFLAMDSDEAGKKARRVIGPSLAEMFDVEDFFAPHKKDPGNMGRPYMNKLWRLTRSS
jgi:hypothetical protein